MNTSDIPFSILSIESTLDLAVQCNAIIQERHPKDASLNSALANLDRSKQKATIAIASSRKKELTEEINAADQKRGRLFIGFRKSVDANQYQELDATAKQAANTVQEIIRTHGTQLHLKPMSTQSSLLSSLFEDLEAADAKAAVNAIGLTLWLNGLKQAQDEFVALVQKRNELEVSKDIATKQEARTELVENLSVVLKGLDFLHSIQPEIYTETSQIVVQITNDMITNERIRSRNPKNEVPEQETETETETEPGFPD